MLSWSDEDMIFAFIDTSLERCLNITLRPTYIEAPALENLALFHIFKNINLNPELTVVPREVWILLYAYKSPKHS